MNVKEIVKEYLVKNGFDCLFCAEGECYIDDLMPCNRPLIDCEPGYKIPCQNKGFDICDYDCDFHIISSKN